MLRESEESPVYHDIPIPKPEFDPAAVHRARMKRKKEDKHKVSTNDNE